VLVAVVQHGALVFDLGCVALPLCLLPLLIASGT